MEIRKTMIYYIRLAYISQIYTSISNRCLNVMDGSEFYTPEHIAFLNCRYNLVENEIRSTSTVFDIVPKFVR